MHKKFVQDAVHRSTWAAFDEVKLLKDRLAHDLAVHGLQFGPAVRVDAEVEAHIIPTAWAVAGQFDFREVLVGRKTAGKVATQCPAGGGKDKNDAAAADLFRWHNIQESA